MILTVTLNACLDMTYRPDEITLGTTCRVGRPQERVGGKGINVARALRGLGRSSTVMGFLGSDTLDVLRSELSTDSALVGPRMTEQMTELTSLTRRSYAMVETRQDRTTLFVEQGPSVSEHDWARFCGSYEAYLPEAEVVVLSGSVPPGLPETCYAELTARAKAHGILVIVDAAGPHLRSAVRACPDVITPTEAELGEAFESLEGLGPDRLSTRAHELIGSVGLVVITLGPAGVLAMDGHRVLRAALPGPVHGNPTGAGDALVAGLVDGLIRGETAAEALTRATACGAAAVLEPIAGSLDLSTFERLRREVVLRVIEDLDDSATVDPTYRTSSCPS